MRDLSVTKSPLSSLYTVKGAIGGLEGDGPANCVHSVKTYTKNESYLSTLHSTAIALMAANKLPIGMEPVDIMLKQARLWIRAASYDPSDNRIEYSDSVPRPPPLSCKAVAAIISSNKKPKDDDDEGSSSGGARTSPPPRAPAVRQSHPTTPSTRPPTGPRSNRGTSKATGRGSGFLFSLPLSLCLPSWPSGCPTQPLLAPTEALLSLIHI